MTPDEWPHIRSIAKCVLPVLVGPRIARTGASERGAISSMWQRLRPAQGSFHRLFKTVLTSIRDTCPCVDANSPCAALWTAEPHSCAFARLAAPGLDERRLSRIAVQRRRMGFAAPGWAWP